jgi:hypothetical protein
MTIAWIPGVSNAEGAASQLEMYDVRDYGATGDNTTDDRTAMQAAIDAAAATGGIVYIPPGTYDIGSALDMKSNVHIIGAGAGATVIEVDNGADDHAFDTVSAITDASLQRLTINGNRSQQTSTVRAHGVRAGGDLTRVLYRDLYIINTSGYGIGLQGATGNGLFDDVTIDNVRIVDPGTDGIDIKNREDASVGIKLSNIFVSGQDQQADGGKAGIDLRGVCTATNIHIEMEGVASGTGILFRDGLPTDASGLGARGSSVTNFYVNGGNTTSTPQNVGVQMIHNRCQLSNGYIEDTYRGIRITANYNHISNVMIDDCWDNGIRIESTSNYCTITGSCVLNCEDHGLYTAGNFLNFTVNIVRHEQTGAGIIVASGATGNLFSSNIVNGTGTSFSDSGTATTNVNMT